MRYETRGNEKFYYFYDASGVISGFRYVNASGTAALYYTLTNAQGDVIAIYDSNGTLVGSYEYDAWGKVLKMTDGSGSVVDEDNTTEIVSINAIRYRGYYYDEETKFYYLQSRYYNPDVGRFLNADGMLNGNGDILGYNMFAYCGNNPVNYSDPSGELGTIAMLAIVTCVFLVTTAVDHYLAKNHPKGIVAKRIEDRTSESTNGAITIAEILYARGSGAQMDQNGARLFDTELGIYTITTHFPDNSEISLANICTAKLVAEMDTSFNFSGEIGGYAAYYSLDFTQPIVLGDITINITATLYFGSISGGIEWDVNACSGSITTPTTGAGAKIGVDLDWTQ